MKRNLNIYALGIFLMFGSVGYCQSEVYFTWYAANGPWDYVRISPPPSGYDSNTRYATMEEACKISIPLVTNNNDYSNNPCLVGYDPQSIKYYRVGRLQICDADPVFKSPLPTGCSSPFTPGFTGMSMHIDCPKDTNANLDLGLCESTKNPLVRRQDGFPDENNSCDSVSSAVGNPINLVNGNKYQIETDLASRYFNFQRFYNSSTGEWTHSYSPRLSIFLYEKQVAYYAKDGRFLKFSISDSSPSGVPEFPTSVTLLKVDQTWVVIEKDRTRYTFDSDGRLISLVPPSGLAQQITYPNTSQLNMLVTDTGGQQLMIVQDMLRRVHSVSSGRDTWAYSYSVGGNRLDTVTRSGPGGASTRSYSYLDGSNPLLLTSVQDERGIRYASWQYDSFQRAISSEHAGVGKVSLVYNSDGTTTVTNELGRKAIYSFGIFNGLKKITKVNGQPTPNCSASNSSYSYDGDGNLTAKIDAKGTQTLYYHNARGLEVTRIEGANTGKPVTIDTRWDGTWPVPILITTESSTLHMGYDENGRLTSSQMKPTQGQAPN